MKTFTIIGRDGSPQPSQVSGATRRLKTQAFQQPEPAIADQKLRSAPFVSHSVFSVSFDSLAPARLALRANLRLLYLKGPAFSIVVNSQ